MASLNPVKISDLQEKYVKKILLGDNGCWNWTGSNKGNGYGESTFNGFKTTAHRAIWLSLGFEIKDNYDLDHLCRNRCCVNPAHLEPVTRSENIRRGNSINHLLEKKKNMTHCKYGHEFTFENTRLYKGKRCCRECARLRYHQNKQIKQKEN